MKSRGLQNPHQKEATRTEQAWKELPEATDADEEEGTVSDRLAFPSQDIQIP